MGWTRRAQNLALLIAVLAGIAAFIASNSGQGHASEMGTGPGVAEIARVIPLEDGRFLEVSALVDTSRADPGAVIQTLAPGGVPEAEVEATFALWRKWAPQNLPVSVSYVPEWDLPSLSARAAMRWGIAQWNGVQGSSFRFTEGPDTDAYATSGLCALQIDDGVNTVRLSYLIPDGTLGVTCVIIGGFESGSPRAVEFDLQLNGTSDWSDAASTPSYAYDLRSVMLHELGHALGLNHTDSAGAVMLPAIARGQQLRTITADDRAGVLALYGTGSTPTPTKTPGGGGGGKAPTHSQSLQQGFNLVGGSFATDLAPGEFVACLPTGSWVSLYIWDAAKQKWQHYFAPGSAPSYVNDPKVGGVQSIKRLAGVVILVPQALPNARFKDGPGSC